MLNITYFLHPLHHEIYNNFGEGLYMITDTINDVKVFMTLWDKQKHLKIQYMCASLKNKVNRFLRLLCKTNGERKSILNICNEFQILILAARRLEHYFESELDNFIEEQNNLLAKEKNVLEKQMNKSHI